MKTAPRDITADIGPMYGPVAGTAPKYPMYSYERAAYKLWQAVFEGLIAAGYSEAKAIEWLQSKSARWALDCELGDKLTAIGFEFGKAQTKAERERQP